MSRRSTAHRGEDVHYGDNADGDDAGVSRSQRKRDATALQVLGTEVAALSDDRLATIDMPDALRLAIAEFKRTRSHEGRRRQMQYVGKLMRQADEAVLREAVAESKLGSARETLALHEAERWRAEFIADDSAQERWAAHHPDTDMQHLRSLVRAARRDAAALPPEARQPKSFRELFQFIRPQLGNSSLGGADALEDAP